MVIFYRVHGLPEETGWVGGNQGRGGFAGATTDNGKYVDGDSPGLRPVVALKQGITFKYNDTINRYILE